MEIERSIRRGPTLAESVAPLIAMGLFLGIGYGVLRLPAEVLLLAAAAVAGLIAHRLGYTYKEIENGILLSMMKGMPAMLIVIVVGALIGSWIACGTIPMLIFYGLKLISPTFFLVTACVVCSVVSVVTGSSFLSILIPGELFAPVYRRRGLAAKNLSRTTEDSGTVVVPLVPWSIAGVFMAGTLGVDTLAYAPWAVMC